MGPPSGKLPIPFPYHSHGTEETKGFFLFKFQVSKLSIEYEAEQKQWLVVGWKFSTGVNSKTLNLKLFEP